MDDSIDNAHVRVKSGKISTSVASQLRNLSEALLHSVVDRLEASFYHVNDFPEEVI